MPEDGPLWATAEDLEIPLGFHIATNRPGGGQEFSAGEQVDRVSSAFLANADHWLLLDPPRPDLPGGRMGLFIMRLQ